MSIDLSTPWKAGHLPGMAPTSVEWQSLRFDAHGRSVTVEVPVLTEAQMEALARHVRDAARRVLQAMPVDGVIEILDRSVARLLDPNEPLRLELDTLLPIVTGYDAEMVRLGLTAYLQTFRAPLRGIPAPPASSPWLRRPRPARAAGSRRPPPRPRPR